MKKSLIIISLLCLSTNLPAELFIDFESGQASSGYNFVRIPGNSGTKFSLSEDLSIKPELFFRATLINKVSKRSIWEFLVAPLTLKAEGNLKDQIVFTDKNFASGSKVNASFRFDSYRVRYLYRIQKTEKTETHIGITAKIRDASIKVSDGVTIAEKKNLGFVPLFGFKLRGETVIKDLYIICEGDALAAPQGRAEDVLIALQYKVNHATALKAGYRVVEGGADNDEVYNFALINYAVLGMEYRF